MPTRSIWRVAAPSSRRTNSSMHFRVTSGLLALLALAGCTNWDDALDAGCIAAGFCGDAGKGGGVGGGGGSSGVGGGSGGVGGGATGGGVAGGSAGGVGGGSAGGSAGGAGGG